MGPAEKKLQEKYTGLCAELGDCTLKRKELKERIREIEARIREVGRGIEDARAADAKPETPA